MSISAESVSGAPIGAQGREASDLNGRGYPYLIQANVALRIANVQVDVVGDITGDGPKVRGTQSDGFALGPTTLSHVGGVRYEANNIDVTPEFPANLTAFYDTFDIEWEVSRDGMTWEYAGTSSNPIYVCLANPNASPASGLTVFRTLVHLACSNPGATDADTAVARTWSLLSGLVARTWDLTTPLYYYRTASTFSANGVDIAALLRDGTGQCLSWAHLLQDAWTLNGIGVNSDSNGCSYYTIATCTLTGDSYFWVKTWSSLPTSDDWFYFESTSFDMIPYPSDGQYGHYDDGGGSTFKNEHTVPGQNSGSGAPSQKVFSNHQFVKYKSLSGISTYFDPSYGVTYASASDFQAVAVSGFGNVIEGVPPISPTKMRLRFKPLTASVIVAFNH